MSLYRLKKLPNKKYKHKIIKVNKELIIVVKLLMEREFKVISTNLETYDMFLGHPCTEKVTLIQIEFGAIYPKAIFSIFPLPPGWVHYDYHTVKDKCISNYAYTAISCSEHHPVTESDKSDIEFAKRLNITNLECWLAAIDPAGFWSVLKLGGLEPYK